MLKAKKNKLFEKVFTVYNKNLIKRRFHSFNVHGLEHLQKLDQSIPTIIIANHSSWWDGLIVFQITQKFGLDFYVMMEEKQLKNLKLFLKLGAFSVVRENPRSAVESINYAVTLLNNTPKISLCLFPQGEILPIDYRPISFYNGISRIIEKTETCQVVIFSICYEFLSDYKPEVFVKVEKAKLIEAKKDFVGKEFTKSLASDLEKKLNQINDLIKNDNLNDFQNII